MCIITPDVANPLAMPKLTLIKTGWNLKAPANREPDGTTRRNMSIAAVGIRIMYWTVANAGCTIGTGSAGTRVCICFRSSEKKNGIGVSPKPAAGD